MNNPMNERIRHHGEQLLAIFPGATEQDPVNLCKKLRRIEAAAHGLAERQCSDPQLDDLESDRLEAELHARVSKLLDTNRVWLNGDPRGYALKVDLAEGEQLYRDWGGYGIIAPDLR